MKKFIALLLALLLALVCVSALAEGKTIPVNTLSAPTKEQTITIKKNYTVDATDNWTLPTDTLTFALKSSKVEDGPATVAPAVSIEVGSIAGGSEAKDLVYDAKIKLPAYEKVGVYYYVFTESDNNVAGITYIKNDITLRVTVTQGENGLVVAGVALRENGETGIKTAESDDTADGNEGGTASTKTEYDLSKKIDSFENKYEAGSLTLTKTVEGNLGDLNKEWEFEVAFTCAKKVNAPITYKERATDADAAKKSIAANWTGTHDAVKVYLKSGETVQFDNIPAGVSYTITETDANKDGYETTSTNATGSIDKKETKAASFLNKKNINIDTGVTLDSAVYMLIMALAVAGFVALKIRRREDY